ncbi:MAG: chromosome partitioning protein ParB [Prevotella sp.]|nr:chromosome partitioning protein ParB [Prevotella sp.]
MKEIKEQFFDGFKVEAKKTEARKQIGSSHNPIIFNDYDAFIEKFKNKNHLKTTDDCYTPRDVYEAVVEYVSEIYDLTDKVILRPFYPGGDYLNAEYPKNGVVIDNPPFSMFKKICEFYSKTKIPYFLFGPGMTVMSICKFGTAVIINRAIRWENGANVRANFATNLFGDEYIAVTAPTLDKKISMAASQQQTSKLKKYKYPPNHVSVSDLQILTSRGLEIKISREEAVSVSKLDNYKDCFGCRLLVSDNIAKEIKEIKEIKDVIDVHLSQREKYIIDKLNTQTK